MKSEPPNHKSRGRGEKQNDGASSLLSIWDRLVRQFPQAANRDDAGRQICHKLYELAVLLADNAFDTTSSAAAQRARLLNALRNDSLTTLEARRLMDVLHPAARIMELRRMGFNIVTVWTTDITAEGNAHRVGRYMLRLEHGRVTA